MIRFTKWMVLVAAGIGLALGGCGGGHGSGLNPTPVILSISPQRITAGGPAFQLSVLGLSLLSNSTVNWNGSPRQTTLDNKTGELIANITQADIAVRGTAEVTISNPAPGGGISTDIGFLIDPAQNPPPVITALNPTSATAGGPAFSLAVSGTGFISLSQVSWNGQPRATSFNAATGALVANISMSDIVTAGRANVQVTNPAPGGGASPIVMFTITASPVASSANSLELVSISSSGGAGNGPSGAPAMDRTGRIVAFQSGATNLVDDGNGGSVFVRDTCAGEFGCRPRTLAVDVAPDGGRANGAAARGISVSGSGRYVAFSSQARNLVAGVKASSPQIYLRDSCLGPEAPRGCLPSTTLVSVANDGKPGDGASEFAAVSATGRFIVFSSAAGNLVEGIAGGTPQIYLRDTCLGLMATAACLPRTVLVSQSAEGKPGNAPSISASISGDGRLVAFDSDASNLTGDKSNGTSNVFLRDTCMGEGFIGTCASKTMLVSNSPGGGVAGGPSFTPAISADGRFLAFVTRANKIAAAAGGNRQGVVVRNLCLDGDGAHGCLPATNFISKGFNGDAHSPSISPDGRFVSFITEEGDGATTGTSTLRAFVFDSCEGNSAGPGCVPRTTLVAAFGPGRAAELPNGNARFGIPIVFDGSDAVISLFSSEYNPVSGVKTSRMGDVFQMWLPSKP